MYRQDMVSIKVIDERTGIIYQTMVAAAIE